MASISV